VTWELQRAKSLGDGDESFETTDNVHKEGFETNLQLPEDKGITPTSRRGIGSPRPNVGLHGRD
jgi:hypothetical protein